VTNSRSSCGTPGFAASSDPPDGFTLADYADCLAAFIERIGLERPHVVGLSIGGGLAIELHHRHPHIPRSLVLVSAYAGWTGSLPSEVVEFRLNQALRLADLPGQELVREIVPTLFSPKAPQHLADRFAEGMREFHPAGLRATARRSRRPTCAASFRPSRSRRCSSTGATTFVRRSTSPRAYVQASLDPRSS
jgi:pimeloyl-ACP methyl ester carboxylesterase